MRFSLNWLRDYVDVNVSPEELKDLLSFSGTKVETMERPAEGIEGIVVAEVLAIAEHPNADTLTLVDVRSGDGMEQRVVCGARNFKTGDKVPLARVGARLPEMEITERKIRGEISKGMLCSGAELGISKDHSGILVLPPEAEPGADVTEVLGLDDVIYDVEVTPNRGDSMGMIGLAREVAALVGGSLRIPELELAPAEIDNPVQVEVADPDGCPRYVARYLEGVTVGPSPAWMAARLLASGVRPISNVVDVTNYVMLETGQPLHAFDARRIRGNRIVVRRAAKNEEMTTLDGVTRRMRPSDLLIADGEGPVAIAGVMGAEDSEVGDGTTSLVIESANFDSSSVSLTARHHGLITEASSRFERGVDPEGAAWAAERACMLLERLAGAKVSAHVVDRYESPVKRRKLTLRPSRTDHLLGYQIPEARQAEHLRSVGFDVEETGNLLTVVVPTFRLDVAREVDLIEEVARLDGFAKLPATIPEGGAGGLDEHQATERRIRTLLSGFGMSEAWTPSLVGSGDADLLGLSEDHPARQFVRMGNPMTEEASVLRTSLLPGLLRAAARNVAQRAESIALYELARIYEPNGDRQLPHEPAVLGAAFCGTKSPRHWRDGDARWDFFGAKGVLEALFRALRLPAPTLSPVKGMPFHPTRAAGVSLDGTQIGALGEIHPEVCDRFDVPEGTVTFELAVAPLLAALPPRAQVAALDRFPAIYLDLAFVVDEDLPAEKIGSLIAAAGEPEVTRADLFDVYSGEQVGEGKKSLAYALELRVPDRTLTDEDAEAVTARIVNAVAERTGAELRT